MSNNDKYHKIILELNIVSNLSSGKTLSTSSMSIIDHTYWSSSIWRTVSGENRQNTISHIKGILNESILLLELNYNEDLSSALNSSLNGFLSLKDTYKGDYYLIADIEKTSSSIKNRLDKLFSSSTMITTSPVDITDIFLTNISTNDVINTSPNYLTNISKRVINLA